MEDDLYLDDRCDQEEEENYNDEAEEDQDTNKKSENTKSSTTTGRSRFVCNYSGCDKSYATGWSMRVHQQRQHLQVRPFPCTYDDCGLSFFAKQHLDRHLKTHNKVKNFKCDFEGCDEAFVKEGDLRRHRCTHTNKLPCPCTEPGCNASFIYPSKLKWHMKVVHPKEKKQICGHEGCGKAFAKLSELQQHIREEHPRVFKCPECQKEFKEKYVLVKHSKIHAGIENTQMHVCTVEGCSMAFTEKLGLTLHIRATHEDTVRYSCSYPGCDKSYTRKQVLSKHELTHQKSAAQETEPIEKNTRQSDIYGLLGFVPFSFTNPLEMESQPESYF